MVGLFLFLPYSCSFSLVVGADVGVKIRVYGGLVGIKKPDTGRCRAGVGVRFRMAVNFRLVRRFGLLIVAYSHTRT